MHSKVPLTPFWLVLAFAACGASRPSPTGASQVFPPAAERDGSVMIVPIDSGVDAPLASDAGVEMPPDAASAAFQECQWVGLDQPAMKPFRANTKKLLDEHAPGEKPTEITCCALSDADALCRARSHKTPSPRDYRYAVYTRLVGVSAEKSEPWFDAPVEVADYKTMKQVNPPWDLELTLTVQGATFSLQENGGKCPRKCSASQGGCKKWEVQAERACKAVGRYERSNGTLNRR